MSCDANLEGAINGTVSFDNSDAAENPFNFGLTCTVTEPSFSAVPIRNRFMTSTPTLTWNPLTWGVDLYDIQIADNSAFNNATLDSSGTNSYTLPNPLPNGLYYWRVRGRNTGRTGAWSTTETMVIAAP